MTFVQDFKVVEQPYEAVAARFHTGIEPVLRAGLVPARAEAERLHIKVAPAGWPAVLAKSVEVRSGRVRELEDGLLVAFSWETGERSLFPRLDADLELAPFGSRQTLIAIRGSYEPPAGILGRRADELLLHRVAESTVRAFLDGVCRACEGCEVST